jgi:hypothetical protein
MSHTIYILSNAPKTRMVVFWKPTIREIMHLAGVIHKPDVAKKNSPRSRLYPPHGGAANRGWSRSLCGKFKRRRGF